MGFSSSANSGIAETANRLEISNPIADNCLILHNNFIKPPHHLISIFQCHVIKKRFSDFPPLSAFTNNRLFKFSENLNLNDGTLRFVRALCGNFLCLSQ
ncbi:hypothetical cytosolic protein [Syntrophus aciditrophicus SB]|uniref:Hypothetical cytosolic protein n=1 Tax=Syntrophus aciditrophicus (strain SB) TaxID=56780 RepID=Q2LXX7_SYNAS|nr:hypothetical cytosolic protein [Syntrophus aciditrophicus SB]